METRPIYNDEGDVVDFQVISHRQGNAHLNTQDYIEQPDGSFKHVFQDVSLESDKQDVSPMNFQMSSYQQALVEAMPDLPAAIQWVENSPDFTVEELEEYNQALDNNDLDAINRFYERLLPLYRQAVAEQSQQSESYEYDDTDADDSELTEWYEDLSDDLIADTVDEIMETTEFSDEQIHMMGTLSDDFEEGTPENQILLAGQLIAQGELSPSDAMEQIIEMYGEAEAARAYFYLQNKLTETNDY